MRTTGGRWGGGGGDKTKFTYTRVYKTFVHPAAPRAPPLADGGHHWFPDVTSETLNRPERAALLPPPTPSPTATRLRRVQNAMPSEILRARGVRRIIIIIFGLRAHSDGNISINCRARRRAPSDERTHSSYRSVNHHLNLFGGIPAAVAVRPSPGRLSSQTSPWISKSAGPSNYSAISHRRRDAEC